MKKLETVGALHTHIYSLKNKKGITLVALVVTIVVLLILAGVSINLVLGQNGIITMGQKAKYRTLSESIKETISSELVKVESEIMQGENITLEEKRTKIISAVKESGINIDDNSDIKVSSNKGLIIINNDNVISTVTGKEAVKGDLAEWDFVCDNTSKKEIGICGYKGTSEDITIPEYIIYKDEIYAVTSLKNCGTYHNNYEIHSDGGLNENKFNGNTVVKNVTMLENITTIDGSTFMNNQCLESVIMPDTIQEFNGGAVFFGCTNLKKCNLSESLTKIPDNLFQGCTSLQEVNIPTSVVEIGNSAFLGVKSLAKVTVPGNVKKIGESAFFNMGMTEIVIEEGVEEIGVQAFALSSKVTTNLKLPSTISADKIGKNAFSGCGAKVYLYNGTSVSTAWE